MPKSRETDVVGDIGAHLAAEVLTPIATVEPRGETMELDFYCELRKYPGCAFHVQAKGSSKPKYVDGFIRSSSISRKTIEEYWLKQPYPVYVIMSDTRARRTFYTRVSADTYEPGQTETYSFKIPLSHELTVENVGLLVPEILRCQLQVTPEWASEKAAEFQETHPFLCHDLDQIDSFLEIMRGSDQSLQLQSKLAIQSMAQTGLLNSQRLESELISILKNCKDRITQSHVLDTLVAIQSPNAAHEVIKQIDRNTRLYEYQSAEPMWRHTYVGFLFRGLARLKITNIREEIRRLIDHPDPNVLQGTLQLIGELKLSGFLDETMMLLDHADRGVRLQASRTLSVLDQGNVESALTSLLRPESTPRQIASAIDALTQSGNAAGSRKVVEFKSHPSPGVRASVARYLGASKAEIHFEDILSLLEDDYPDVSSEALQAWMSLSTVPPQRKEEAILPRLRDAFVAGRELQASALMGALSPYASSASYETLVFIYRRDRGETRNYASFDQYGNWLSTVPIDLRTTALNILKKFDITELHDDICESIKNCERDLLPRYLEVAREKQIVSAFDAIASLSRARFEFWSGFCLQTMCEISLPDTLEWCKKVVVSTESLKILAECCDLLERHHVDARLIEHFVPRLLALFSDLKNRSVPFLYRLVRRYQLVNAATYIVADLPLLLGPARDSLRLPVSEMFETLAALDYPRGHEELVKFLPQFPPDFRRAVIDYLWRYQPTKALPVIKQGMRDPELSIREFCEVLLTKANNEPSTPVSPH